MTDHAARRLADATSQEERRIEEGILGTLSSMPVFNPARAAVGKEIV